MTLPFAWRGKLHGAADGAPPGPYAPSRRYREVATGKSNLRQKGFAHA